MGFRWSLSGIPLVCPICKNQLGDKREQLECESCILQYAISDGIPIMLADQAEGSDERKSAGALAQKEMVKRTFDSINRSLEEKGLSRFSTFINWGYIPLQDEEQSDQPNFNKSYMRLLQEIVGEIVLKDKDIIEIGCGRGGNINALCKSFAPRNVVGLDLTESNIVFCLQNNRYQQVYYCVGDAEQLPFQAESCDVLLNVESSHLYPRIDKFYEEAYRVLKPAGVFLYADIFDSTEFKVHEDSLRKLGFTIVMNRDITENILLSGELALQNHLYALGGTFENDNDTVEWLEAPGTKRHKDMLEGRRIFKILQLIKSY